MGVCLPQIFFYWAYYYFTYINIINKSFKVLYAFFIIHSIQAHYILSALIACGQWLLCWTHRTISCYLKYDLEKQQGHLAGILCKTQNLRAQFRLLSQYLQCNKIFQFSSVSQSCSTLCDSVDCSPPGFSVRGILQARILEWIPMPSSRRFSQPRDRTCVSYVSCLGRWVLYRQHHLGRPFIHFGAFFKISIILKMWPYQSEDDNLSGNWPV